MDTIEFRVPGEPHGKARPRVCKNGITYTPKTTRIYENSVLTAYARTYGVRNIFFPKGTPVLVEISARFSIPKSWSNKKKRSMYGKPHAQKPDADNIAKAILDGVAELPFDNDCQVSSCLCTKRWCNEDEEPSVSVRMITDTLEINE